MVKPVDGVYKDRSRSERSQQNRICLIESGEGCLKDSGEGLRKGITCFSLS